MSRRFIKTTDYVCDRCGYVDSNNTRWLCRAGVDLCPGCDLDLLRFLSNEAVEPMGTEEAYRFPDPDLVHALRQSLQARGVSPYGTGSTP